METYRQVCTKEKYNFYLHCLCEDVAVQNTQSENYRKSEIKLVVPLR